MLGLRMSRSGGRASEKEGDSPPRKTRAQRASPERRNPAACRRLLSDLKVRPPKKRERPEKLKRRNERPTRNKTASQHKSKGSDTAGDGVPDAGGVGSACGDVAGMAA